MALSKQKNHHITHNGSTLLIAIVTMGIMMMLAIGVSRLMLDSLKINRLIAEKMQASYAAESALELALFEVDKETHDMIFDHEGTLSASGTNYSYEIFATGDCFPPDSRTNCDSYATLNLNESVTIPLFRGPAEEEKVTQFRLDFFISPEISVRSGIIPENLDVLRWKIFGIENISRELELISEFSPQNAGATADAPTTIGTGAVKYNAGTFYDHKGTVLADGSYPAISIEEFLRTHSQNFLVFSNMINTDLITNMPSNSDKQANANIKFRLRELDGKSNLTMPKFQISVDGRKGEAVQSFDLEVPRTKFLPVFNFALYRTAE